MLNPHELRATFNRNDGTIDVSVCALAPYEIYYIGDMLRRNCDALGNSPSIIDAVDYRLEPIQKRESMPSRLEARSA